jgi:peptidoglycan/LPS O-acetylase OafA/YrhL
MLLAVGSAWIAMGGGLPWIARALARSPAACWLLALEMYWLTLQLRLGEPFSRGNNWQALGLAGFHGICAFFFVFPAVFGDQDHGGIRAFLRSRAMVYLGLISYGIYLWHKPFTELSAEWAADGYVSDNFFLQLVIILALTIAVASASYFGLEKPLINWSRRRRPPRAKAPTTPAPVGRATPS